LEGELLLSTRLTAVGDSLVDCAGDFVRRATICILFILLGRTIAVPAVALAGTSSVQSWPHTDSREKYEKHQNKAQKKARKAQKRMEKKLRRQHHAEH
jgi:cytochrome c-type biogenesis protein CcmH/NrfG